MRVSVTTTGSLERQMAVSVPAEELETKIVSRLDRLRKSVRLPGFRPGKAPVKIIEAKYGPQVIMEAAGELIETSYREALGKEGLVPAGGPSIEQKQLERGQDLEYVATFEVFPEIGHPDLKDCRVVRPVCEVEDADVERTIENIRKQRVQWDPKDGAAEAGDQVVIDFTGSIDGEVFKGGTATDFEAVLGAGGLLPDFETGLTGAKAGDSRNFEVGFPENYPGQDVAGKRAAFEVTVKAVNSPRLPELNNDFARELGVGDGSLETLRDEIRSNLQREMEDRLRLRQRDEVLKTLLDRNDIDLPKRLVEEEINRLYRQRAEELKRYNMPVNDPSLDRSVFEEEAKRRVALGLTLREVIEANDIKVDPARVRRKVESLAASYEQPEEVMKWYYADPSRLAQMESMALEDQVVDTLLSQAETDDRKISFEELMYGHGQPG